MIEPTSFWFGVFVAAVAAGTAFAVFVLGVARWWRSR